MKFAPAEMPCAHCWDDGCIRNVSYNTAVHKDDCAYCCLTNKHEDGVYVCMACFGGFCAHHLEKHMALQPSHAMYVNLKQLPPKEIPEETVKDVNYLGVAAPPEYSSAVCCAACKIKFAEPEGVTADCYTRILDSTSVGTKDAISGEAVFGSRTLCPHLVSLTQDKSPFTSPPTSSEKCVFDGCECRLNNWMCVTCGAVGCPRPEAGGQAHAIHHYTETNHPVVVKLGTVTPEGADYYCYACDDEVTDVQFAAHMAHFGIDVKTAVKSAKTLGEMMYDVTSQFDFNIITESGEDLIPVYGPGHTGMWNFGNTCYISSVVQCLFALPPFRAAFNGGAAPHWVACKEDPYNCPTCQTEKVASGLLSGNFAKAENEPRLNGVTPREFKKVFARQHPEFSTADQQDAQEYLMYILQELARRVQVEKTAQLPLHPSQYFEMKVENRIACAQCKKVRYSCNADSCLVLVPPVKPPVGESVSANLTDEQIEAQRQRSTLDECLAAWLSPSTVECRCEDCKQPTTYTTTTRLKSFPDFLAVYVRRAYFDSQAMTVKKLDVYVNVPETIDLSGLRGTGLQPDEVAMAAVAEAQKKPQANPAEVEVDEIALVTLISMGIDDAVARYALRKTEMNVERAIDYVFSHPDIEIEVAQESSSASAANEAAAVGASATASGSTEPAPPTDGEAKYKLSSMISHMGASAKSGHYVCHIKDAESGKWVLFNDEKVAESKKPPFNLASVYIFTRESQ